jgi:hypothetical protein
MTSSTTYVIIPFKSRGRLFVEIPELVERNGQIVAGEPLQLEVIGEDIVYRKIVGPARPYRNDSNDLPSSSLSHQWNAAKTVFAIDVG